MIQNNNIEPLKEYFFAHMADFAEIIFVHNDFDAFLKLLWN